MQAVCNLDKNRWLNTAIKYLLIATNIAFLVYFVVLAIYARPHYDDVHFLYDLQEMSIFDYIKDTYYMRSGRFGAYFLNGIIYTTINSIGISWPLPILFMIFGMLMSCYVAIDMFPNMNKWWLCNFVVLFYSLYILTNIDFAVVYWLCAMGYYLKFPIALLLFNFINKKQLCVWQWIVLILASITIGAGNEAFSPLILVFLFINGMYYLHTNHYNFRNAFADSRVKKICIIVFIIIALMLIVFVAPGNYIRMADTTEAFYRPTGITEWIIGLLHACTIYHYMILFYVPYYFVLMSLAYLLGVKSKQNGWCAYLSNNKKNILIGLLVIYVVYILCAILPSVFLYGNFGIQRNYTHAVFMTMLTLCTIGFMYGYWNPSIEKYMRYLSAIGLFLLCSVMIVNCIIDFPTAKTYADSVDERVEYCNKMQSNGYIGELVVEPLVEPRTVDVKHVVHSILNMPNTQPMLFYISETDQDPNEYAHHMKHLYKWDFNIVLENEK